MVTGRSVVVALGMLAGAAPAAADPKQIATVVVDGPPGSDIDAPPRVQPVPLEPPKIDVRTAIERRNSVAGSGRGLFWDTALTVPSGEAELAIDAFIPFGFAKLSAGLTSSTELTVDVGKLFEDHDGVALYGLGLKQVLGRGANWQVALTGSVHQFTEDSGGGSTDNENIVLLGGVASLCADKDCSFLLSAGIQGMFVKDESETPLLVTLAASLGGESMRFLVELTSVADANLMLLGLRFGGHDYVFDLGVATAGDSGDLAGVPVVGFTARM